MDVFSMTIFFFSSLAILFTPRSPAGPSSNCDRPPYYTVSHKKITQCIYEVQCSSVRLVAPINRWARQRLSGLIPHGRIDEVVTGKSSDVSTRPVDNADRT